MEHLKVKVNASKATSIHKYENPRLKLLKCNANIHFNKQCIDLRRANLDKQNIQL
jgi:hypothetical protein